MVGLKTKKRKVPVSGTMLFFPLFVRVWAMKITSAWVFKKAGWFLHFFESIFFLLFNLASCYCRVQSVPVRSSLERPSELIGRGLFFEHSAVIQRWQEKKKSTNSCSIFSPHPPVISVLICKHFWVKWMSQSVVTRLLQMLFLYEWRGLSRFFFWSAQNSAWIT